MNQHYKPNERELVKLATFFKKESKRLMAEGRLSEENKKVEEAVDRFIAHLEQHANTRAFIEAQRQQLQKLVKDEAECPKCHKRDMLKLAGTEKNQKGWKSNRYRCRRCNIAFTWNRPNNPWDIIHYTEEMLQELSAKLEGEMSEAEKAQTAAAMQNARASLEKIKPVIEAHDKEYHDLQKREEDMDKLVHEFKNSLMIEKIKMDTWENRKNK
jgi:hypothetical protein